MQVAHSHKIVIKCNKAQQAEVDDLELGVGLKQQCSQQHGLNVHMLIRLIVSHTVSACAAAAASVMPCHL